MFLKFINKNVEGFTVAPLAEGLNGIGAAFQVTKHGGLTKMEFGSHVLVVVPHQCQRRPGADHDIVIVEQWSEQLCQSWRIGR